MQEQSGSQRPCPSIIRHPIQKSMFAAKRQQPLRKIWSMIQCVPVAVLQATGPSSRGPEPPL